MEAYITPDAVANIVLFIIPGYFALRTYMLIYSKPSIEFSHIFLRSVAYSLPLVSLYAFVWERITNSPPAVTSARYVLPLLLVSAVTGWLASYARRAKFLRNLEHLLHLPEADEDFLRLQFGKLGKNERVTVTLKSGDIFLGMPLTGSTIRDGAERQYSFVLIAWFDEDRKEWEESSGTLIVALAEVLYIQTETPLDA